MPVLFNLTSVMNLAWVCTISQRSILNTNYIASDVWLYLLLPAQDIMRGPNMFSTSARGLHAPSGVR